MGNMPLIITTLILLIILIVLVLIYVLRQKARKNISVPAAEPVPKQRAELSFEQLIGIMKDKSSSAEQLSDAVEKMADSYGLIPPKLGSRPHPDFERYQMAILLLCRHPHVNKNIILSLDRALASKNPAYAAEIELSLKQGLSSRGA